MKCRAESTSATIYPIPQKNFISFIFSDCNLILFFNFCTSFLSGKEKAESILSTLGIPASSAINMFYKQIILQRGLPFEVKIPSARPVDISTLSEVEFNEELEKGYADMQAGRTKNAKKAFADIRKDYGL